MSGLPARFWAKVDKTGPGGCWIWTAALNDDGYGIFSMEGRTHRAHRLTYEDSVRPPEPTEKVDHRCFVHACVNPSHLQAVSHQQNMENRSGLDRNNTSGARGVVWDRRRRRWRAQVVSAGRQHFGGYFDNKLDAEEAAVSLRSRLMTNNLIDREGDRGADTESGRPAA